MKEKHNNIVSFLQWNCRSLNSNADLLRQYLCEHKYDVLVLQSLNVERNNVPKLDGFFYPPIRQCNTQKVYTAIYIADNLDYSFCKSPISFDLPNIYSCSVKVKVKNDKVINVISFYLPKGPCFSPTDWLKSDEFTKDLWLVAGDVNAHSPLWEEGCTSVTSNQFVENIVDSSLSLLNDGRATRIPDVSAHKATAIDLTLVSPQLVPDIDWETVEDPLGSDHIPIRICINTADGAQEPDKDKDSDKVPKFKYDCADWAAYQQELLNIEIDDITSSPDLDRTYSLFTEAILTAAKKTIPQCKTSKKGKHTGNVWWTAECATSVKRKKEAFKEYKSNRSTENHIAMKRAKIECNKTIASAKQYYWSNYSTSCVSDYKDVYKVWSKVKEIRSSVVLPKCPIMIESNEFPSSYEKAESFVTFFADNSSLSGLSEKRRSFRQAEEQKDIYSDPQPDNSHYTNSDISVQEIIDTIKMLPTKRSSVGIDGVSNDLIRHLPEKWLSLLAFIFNRCWSEGKQPEAWKTSIVVPILKSGKPKQSVGSYRPISLTSHVSKLMERIVLNRLTHFCTKQNIIPPEQAGFMKGRSTTDHLVKLTTHVKRQFARRKSVLATFFDVKKAYDQVWHARLLYKVKRIGITGKMYAFVKSFLFKRKFQAKVGLAYSSTRQVDMGIPQGSVLAPFLFILMLRDLPSKLTKDANVVQYADDIAIWINCSLRGKASVTYIKHVSTIYQTNLNSLQDYMSNNGFELSSEKTSMMLFNNGKSSDRPRLYLNSQELVYSESVKFLGVLITRNLNWKLHLDQLLTQARKNYNLLKVINKQKWSQSSCVLIHLAESLVRSKLIYGQEVYFSASKTYLKKLQSIDSKAIKLALGVPIHTSTIGAYTLAGILPLDDVRKLAAASYIVRSQGLSPNSTNEEVHIRSDIDFPKKARSVRLFKTIATYTADLFDSCDIKTESLTKASFLPPIPSWELKRASFDCDYISMKKSENPNIVSALAQEHLGSKYSNHLQVYTDGSVIDGIAGSGYVIPALKINKSYHLGKFHSIFIAELVAILMSLYYLCAQPISFLQIVFCVDSMSVINALSSPLRDTYHREILSEIRFLIHSLFMNGTHVSFCWVPSHLNILANNWADSAAKDGALCRQHYIDLHVPLSVIECKSILKRFVNQTFTQSARYRSNSSLLSGPKYLTSLLFRLQLGSWKTKYVSSINCVCGEKISVKHIICSCHVMKNHLGVLTPLPEFLILNNNLQEFLLNNLLDYPVYPFLHKLLSSPIIQFI